MKRYLQLDFLRGLCLLVMTIDHFGNLSLVEIFGFISAAEGFVFISGIVSGIVYYRRLQKESFETLRTSAFQRAFQLYKYHIACLAVLILVSSVGIPAYETFYEHKAGLFSEDILLASLLNVIFLYRTYHLDILPMYVLFLLALPLALKYVDSKAGRYLLFGSFVAWLMNLLGATSLLYTGLNQFIPADPGNFQVLGWQFLFFSGFALGVLEVRGELDSFKRRTSLFFLSLVLLLVLFVCKRTGWPVVPEELSGILFGKSTIGLVRIINFLALAYVITFVFRRYEQLGKNSWLRLLGRHSLYVFTFQTLVLFVFIPFYQQWFIDGFLAESFESKILRKGLSLAFTLPLSLIIFLPAYWREQKAKSVTVVSATQ